MLVDELAVPALSAGRRGILHALDALEDAVDAALSVDPRTCQGLEAIEGSRRLRAVVDRLRAQRLGLIGQIERDGLWALDAVRTFPLWLAEFERLSRGQAQKDVRSARLLRDHLPATLDQARRGDVTVEHVRVVTGIAATSDTRRATLAAAMVSDVAGPVAPGADEASAEAGVADAGPRVTGEQVLLGYATGRTMRDFTRIARRFAVVADPESDERGFRRAAEREYLQLSPTLDGFHVQGFLTEEHGQVAATALAAAMGPREQGCQDSQDKRRAVALVGLLRAQMDRGLVTLAGAGAGAGGGAGDCSAADADDRARDAVVRPHLSVTVSWTELQEVVGATAGHGAAARLSAGTATASELAALIDTPESSWGGGRGPVPRSVLRQIAADCELTRVVFGPDSQAIDVGRTQRTFTGPRRRAVIARDKHCVWPGCQAPPEHGQIHHARLHWADGGVTATDNAALLCWFHHDYVDRRRIAMSFADGRWQFGEIGSYSVRR